MRRDGYYWVKDAEGWDIAFWSSSLEQWAWDGEVYTDSDWKEINETRLKSPDEA